MSSQGPSTTGLTGTYAPSFCTGPTGGTPKLAAGYAFTTASIRDASDWLAYKKQVRIYNDAIYKPTAPRDAFTHGNDYRIQYILGDYKSGADSGCPPCEAGAFLRESINTTVFDFTSDIIDLDVAGTSFAAGSYDFSGSLLFTFTPRNTVKFRIVNGSNLGNIYYFKVANNPGDANLTGTVITIDSYDTTTSTSTQAVIQNAGFLGITLGTIITVNVPTVITQFTNQIYIQGKL